MSGNTQLFRRRALEHAGDPEALDVLPLLPRPMDRVALLLLTAILAAFAVWTVLGTVTRTVAGSGILIAKGGQLVEAQSAGPGQITALAVRPGMPVEAGTVIATVVVADREQRLVGARSLVEARRTNLQRVRETIERVSQQRLAAAALQREALEARLRVARERIGTATNQFEIQDGLFRRGLATLQRVNDARDAVNNARLDEASTLTSLADVAAKLGEDARGDAERATQAEVELAAADRALAELQAESAMSSRVVAPVPGRVVEVKANLCAMVSSGQAIVSIETGRPGLELLAFIPARTAREVGTGMTVRISPAGTTREEHGELLGTVLDISSFPVSAAGLRSLLQNETLAQTLSREGSPYVARIALVERPGQSGAYVWTTRQGDVVALSSGGLASIEVAASKHRPIDLVLPAVRKFFGF